MTFFDDIYENCAYQPYSIKTIKRGGARTTGC